MRARTFRSKPRSRSRRLLNKVRSWLRALLGAMRANLAAWREARRRRGEVDTYKYPAARRKKRDEPHQWRGLF